VAHQLEVAEIERQPPVPGGLSLRSQSATSSWTAYAVFCPHSGQNRGFPSIAAPQLPQCFFCIVGVPHSGQNLAPPVLAPQALQVAPVTWPRSRFFIQSTCWAFSKAWDFAASAWAEAISS